jgi:hypothetical protein
MIYKKAMRGKTSSSVKSCQWFLIYHVFDKINFSCFHQTKKTLQPIIEDMYELDYDKIIKYDKQKSQKATGK